MSDADQDTEENIRMRAYLLWSRGVASVAGAAVGPAGLDDAL